MPLRASLARLYQRKSFLDPTKNYSQLPQKLVNKYQGKRILNVGSGQEPLAEHVISLDKYEPADITGDAVSLPIKSKSVDLALSIAVLEHLKEPAASVDEIFRALKPGGQVYIEIPFLQPFHSSPHDFYRATLPGLKHWCRRFHEIDSGVCVGPGSAHAWITIEYVRLLFSSLPPLGLIIEIITRLLTLPLKFFDAYLINKKNAHITASAIYFHGRKSKS